jgi:DNA-binding CsgD family transcriptional regulator
MNDLKAFFRSSFSEIVDPGVIGLALHRAWIAAFFFSANTLTNVNVNDSYPNMTYSISLAALIVVLLLGGLLPKPMKKLMQAQALKVLSPALVSVGTLLLLATTSPDTSYFASLLSGLFTGIGSGFLLLYWGEVYGSSDSTTAQIHSALAFTLALFVYALFLLLSSSLLYILVGTILPLLSGIVLIRALRIVPNERETNPIPGGDINVLRVAAVACVISFVHAALIGVRASLPLANGSVPSLVAVETSYAFTLFVSTLIIAVLIFVTIFVSKKPNMGLIYRFVLIFTIIGVLFSPFFGLPGSLSSIIVNTGYSCFELIFWIALSNICFRYHIPPVQVFGLGRVGWAIGVFLGGLHPPLPFLEIFQVDALTAPFFLVAILIIFVVVSYAFILPEHTIVAITIGFGGRHGSLQSRCQKLSRQFSLTQRESEVLACLVKGRDTSYIQHFLNISAGTVSTHRQRIYQKTGVHSRQELLDLLEETRSEDSEDSVAAPSPKPGP